MLITCFTLALANAAAAQASADPTPRATSAAVVSSTATAGNAQTTEKTYRLPLALAYGLPLSFQLATWFVPSLQSSAYTGLGLVSMLAAPFIVHAAHDNDQGAWVAELGIVSSLLGGAVVGAVVLIGSGQDVCRDCDDGIGEVASQIGLGGAVGAGVGYLTWAIIDTALNAEPRAGEALATPIVLPTIAVMASDTDDLRSALSRVSLGLTGVF